MSQGTRSPNTRRVVVVGAGIAGLAAAHTLRSVPDEGMPEVVVLEASSRSGGLIRTENTTQGMVEWGPEGLFATPPMRATLGDLGLDVITPNTSSSGSMLALGGRLRPLPLQLVRGSVPPPSAVVDLVRHGVLRPRDVLRILAEPALSLRRRPPDTLASTYSHLLGRRAMERLMAPFAEGVLGAPADRLADSVVPRPAGRSLLMASLRSRTSTASGGMVTVVGGMSRLVDALAEALDVRLNTRVITIHQAGDRYEVVTDDRVIDADVVIMATPPPTTARILEEVAPRVSAALATVTMTSSAVLQVNAVRSDGSSIESFPSGGWLAAPEENPLIAAGSFVGHKWPHLGCPGRVRVIIRRPDLLSDEDELLIARALDETEQLLNVCTRRDTAQLHRSQSSLPMRAPATAAQIQLAKAALPPSMHLAGTAETVVGVSAAFASGLRAATAVQQEATRTAGRSGGLLSAERSGNESGANSQQQKQCQ